MCELKVKCVGFMRACFEKGKQKLDCTITPLNISQIYLLKYLKSYSLGGCAMFAMKRRLLLSFV